MITSRPLLLGCALAALLTSPALAETIVVDAGKLFDGSRLIEDARMVVDGGRVVEVDRRADVAVPAGARVLDHGRRFVMPGLIAVHSHVGGVSGTEHGGRFYSRETVERDLKQFADYGIVAVNALGMNRPLFHELRREFRDGRHENAADLYGAGPGVGAWDGSPPVATMGVEDDQVMRAATPEEAREAVRRMAANGVDVIKGWVDDLGGKAPKMKPEIYRAAIEEAHAQGLKAAAHIHDLGDARGVVEAGVDILGHGVRDEEVDAAFVELLRDRGTWYVPTINIDEAEYVYAENPQWLNDAFFAKGGSTKLRAQISDADWRAKALSDAGDSRKAVEMNIRNLALLDSAGVKIAMGTDSGATALRIPGFAEHRELELMAKAGMSNLDILAAATTGGAEMMGFEDRGRLVPGARTDFVVLDGDPISDITATRSIHAVFHPAVER